MANEFFSNHTGGSSELTVIANIIPGYVPGRFPITYSARLRRHLRLLNGLRRNGLEGRNSGVYTGPIDTLRSLQFFHWTLIENDTKMLLAVNFDRPLQPYLRRIVDVAGPLLDSILCNCEDYIDRSSEQGFHQFMAFARKYQAPVELFAASDPDVSTDDRDYYLQADKQIRERIINDSQRKTFDAEIEHTRLKFTTPKEQLQISAKKWPMALLGQGMSILQALYETHHFYPKKDAYGRGSRDDFLYYRLAEQLVPGFWGRMLTNIRSLSPQDPLPNADVYDLKDQEVYAVNQIIEGLIAQGTTDPKLGALLETLERHSEARNWFAKRPEPRVLPKIPTEPHKEIQGGLKEPLDKPNVSCMLLLRVDNPLGGRKFLKAMQNRLWPTDESDTHWNLSITHAGLKVIGINEDLRQRLPEAFREGMAKRAGLLGDIGINNPREWKWPETNWVLENETLKPGDNTPILPDSIDIIIQVSKKSKTPAHEFSTNHPLFDDITALANRARDENVTLLAVEPMLRNYDEDSGKVRGHIGFLDGISQPRFNKESQYKVENLERGKEVEDDRSILGDLLIGHASKLDLDYTKKFKTRTDEKQIKPFIDYTGSSLQDGTFQVIRKLKIDTTAFNAAGDSDTKNKLVGREANGTPLSPDAKGYQDFNFVNDPHGDITPLQSHIRRTNPRQADTPRILRRGWSYGPFDSDGETTQKDRGMFFIAYNANISEQFETIQRWVSGGNSTGISSGHGDPLLAPVRSGGSRTFRYMDNGAVKYIDMPDRPPATLEWGLYAFTPSQAGLLSLAEGGAVGTIDDNPIKPPTVRRLQTIDVNASLEEWKLELEDIDDNRRANREAIWREIRTKHNGVLKTNYGVLVGSASTVEAVLQNNENVYSVRHYWDRMNKTIGTTHLSYDNPPKKTKSTDADEIALDKKYRAAVSNTAYKEESAKVNPFFIKREDQKLFKDAEKIALEILNKIPIDKRYLIDKPTPVLDGRRMSSERFIYDLIAKLCEQWFGLPDKDIDLGGPEKGTPHCPIDFVRGSFYVFWPHPTEHVKATSEQRTSALLKAVTAHVQGGGDAAEGTLMKELLCGNNPEPEFIAKAVAGACFGFAGPTSGSFRAVLYDWITTGFLWRFQQQIQGLGKRDYSSIQPLLEPKILESMARRAAPDLLYRTAVADASLGGTDIKAGDRVVISLRSAAEDDPKNKRFFLFGGNYNATDKTTQPQHTCPGQRMAICTIMGALSAIMSFKEIRPESPLSVRLY